jgi:hypothetical protein
MLVDRMNPSLLGSKKNGSRARKNAQACLIKSAIWHQGRELIIASPSWATIELS